MNTVIDQVQIRTDYQSGDIGYITYLHGILYDFGAQFEAYVAETLATFYKSMNPEKERMWIAELDGKMIGTIAIKNTDGQGQLRYFLIHPDYRGIGLGKKLMKCFMDYLRSAGYSHSFLLTEKRLETAIHMYEQNGYRYVSSNVTDFGLDELRYEWHLDYYKN